MTQPSFLNKCKALLEKPFFHDTRTVMWLWIILAIVGALTKLHRCNNFIIFRQSFWHAWDQLPLYSPYPAEYFDIFYYGPVFPVLVMPFAVTPLAVGLVMWTLALTLFLYLAVRHSQFTHRQQLFILWFCAHELLTAIFMQQFNIAIAAIILLSYYLIEKEKDFWSAFFIVLGTLVKLYGVVGLAFFFFSKHKGRFVGSLLFWAVVLFALPMLMCGPDYVVEQYGQWITSLTEKNSENLDSFHQNISLLGMVQRISGATFSNLWLIGPGLVLFALPYLRFSQYKNMAFRQTLLASVLMFVVLFSTGSESSGYIIALTGVVVWYTAVPWKRSHWDIALMVFAFILTSLSPSDLFPAYIRKEWVQPYALKALPVSIVWLQLCYEMLVRDYATKPVKEEI